MMIKLNTLFITRKSLLVLILTVFSANSYGIDQTGIFEDQTAERLPVDDEFGSRASMGDLDNDGDYDIIVANGTFTNLSTLPPQDFLLQINDGTGLFTNEANSRLPSTAFGTYYAAAAVLGDVDGDGDLDVFVANGTSSSLTFPEQLQNRLWINDGSGVFSDQTTSRIPIATDTSMHAAMGDIDGDGDLDAIIGNVGVAGFGDQNTLLINNGAGIFTDETESRLPSIRDVTLGVAFEDLNADGNLDLIVANRAFRGSKIMMNNGSGVFVDETASRLVPTSASAGGIKVADINGDGEKDIIFSSLSGGPLIYINDGSGFFNDESIDRAPQFYNLEGLSLADFDRDNDLDAYLSIPGENSVLLFNDGDGFFTDVTSTNLPETINNIVRYPACGDVDNDGDADIYLPVTFNNLTAQQDRILINLGDPLVLIEDLRDLTAEYDLGRGTERSLLNKLNKAYQKLTNNNASDDDRAISLLNSYVSAVESKAGQQIPVDVAEILVGAAEEIIDRLTNPAKCI